MTEFNASTSSSLKAVRTLHEIWNSRDVSAID